MSPRLSNARRARGFSLIEVLVAFVILALVATALFQLFSGALLNAVGRRGLEPRGAGRGKPARPPRRMRCRWSRQPSAAMTTTDASAGRAASGSGNRRTVDPELARISEGMTTRLYRVEVDVRFPGIAGRERTLSLATVRLAGKDLPR